MEQQFFGVSLEKLLTSGGQTLYMVALALIIGTVIGIVLALILVLCKKGGLAENLILYNIVSIYINIVRSIPLLFCLWRSCRLPVQSLEQRSEVRRHLYHWSFISVLIWHD